jgi:hypothetical protein
MDSPHCLKWLLKKCNCFLEVTVRTGDDQKDTLKDYWQTQEQVYVAFYKNIMIKKQILSYIYIPAFL